MALRIRAIRPRRNPMATNINQLIDEELDRRGFAGDVIREMSDYPPQQPAYGVRQSLGKPFGNRRRKRSTIGKGYKRTGQYGRNWKITGTMRTPSTRSVTVSNPIRYAIFVGGPEKGRVGARQTEVMREKGWKSISVVAREQWAKRRPVIIRIITQQDPRLRRDVLPQ